MVTYSKTGSTTLTFTELSSLATQARSNVAWATKMVEKCETVSKRLDEMQAAAAAKTKTASK